MSFRVLQPLCDALYDGYDKPLQRLLSAPTAAEVQNLFSLVLVELPVVRPTRPPLEGAAAIDLWADLREPLAEMGCPNKLEVTDLTKPDPQRLFEQLTVMSQYFEFVANSRARRASVDARINKAENNIEALKTQLGAKDVVTDLTSLRTFVQSEKSRNEELDARLTSLETRLRTTKKNQEKFDQASAEMEQVLKRLRPEVPENLEEEVRHLASEVVRERETRAALLRQSESAHITSEAFQDLEAVLPTLQGLREQWTLAQQRLQRQEDETARTSAEKARVSQELEDEKKNLAEVREEASRLEKRQRELKAAQAANATRRQQTEQELNEAEDEARSFAEHQNQVLRSLESRLVELESEADSRREYFTTTIPAFDAASERLRVALNQAVEDMRKILQEP